MAITQAVQVLPVAGLCNRVEITLFTFVGEEFFPGVNWEGGCCGGAVWSAGVPGVLSLQDGTAPLWIASQMGHSDVVRVMLLRGADRDATRNVSLSDSGAAQGLWVKTRALKLRN